MSNTTFPNGLTLTSSANTPDTINGIFQPIIASIFGIDPVANPSVAFSTVRVGWQRLGQPAWLITEDVCIIRATAVDDPYSRVRDNLYAPNDSVSVNDKMGFTQVWNVHCTLYGPNSYDRARLILSAITLDWVHDALSADNLYLVVAPARPVYVPELFGSQWWKRADLDIRYNEQVNESITVSSAAGVAVTVITDSGLTDTFEIGQS